MYILEGIQIDTDIIQAYKKLDAKARETSKNYFHSSSIATYTASESEIKFDLRDVLLISALTGNHVLLSGGTGCGKTHIAKMMMAALFGNEGYKFLQIDANFSLEKLRDITFETIAKGGKLSEAVKAAPIVKVPGVVIDEYNRAPKEITNIIQGWLQNGTMTFEGGHEVVPGYTMRGGEKYQWKIATINEGARYSGARDVDKASRDRLSVEIPMGIFTPTDEDKRKLRGKKNTNVDISDGQGSLEDVLILLTAIREIPITGAADEFLLYLQRMSQCIKTPNKTKEEIPRFSPEYCKGCHLAKEHNNICGSIERAPSDRAIINLQNLARGFAFLRYTKGIGEAKADIEDIKAASPFMLFNKLDIHPGWVDKNGQGSLWHATNTAINIAFEKFYKFLSQNYEHLASTEPESLIAIKKYAENNDCWTASLK